MYVRTITGAAIWASYLINGDASGLDDAEIAACDAWKRIELNDVNRESVVNCAEEAHFTWHYDLHTHTDTRGGDVIEYTVLGMSRRERKRARKLAQWPFNYRTEDRKAYLRALNASLANLHVLLAYRDCWQYGRYVHGAVSGTKQAFISALYDELRFARGVRVTR